MPTAAIQTYSNQKLEPAIRPDLAVEINVRMGASLNIAKGTVLAQKTSDLKWYAYDDGHSDGTEVARGIAQFDMQTDSAGLVTLSSTASQAGGEHGEQMQTAPVWVGGFFYTEDLTGLDAAGVADLGRLIKGDTTSGILSVQ